MNDKRIPLGIEFYETVATDCYYVDKTNIIENITNFPIGTCLLFTRPRRFGKSLMLSMLQSFYELNDIDKSKYFIDKYIWNNKEIVNNNFQKYPLIHINLKNVIGLNFSSLIDKVKDCMKEEYQRHAEILSMNVLDKYDVKYFNSIISKEISSSDLSSSLYRLSKFLYDTYQKQVIILIDEYDTPVHYAYDYNFYDEAIMFFKQFFGESLKGNPCIHLAILTGILQIAKESLFSGLNNLVVNSILTKNMAEGFGFNEKEVKDLLKYYNFNDRYEDVVKYYGGYKFGNTLICNPLSLLSFIQHGGELDTYWTNTGESSTLTKLLAPQNISYLLPLLKGDSIQSDIDIAISYKDIDESMLSVSTYLLASGYLTIKQVYDDYYELIFPNLEIKEVFEREVRSRYLKKEQIPLVLSLKKAFKEGNTTSLEELIRKYLLSSFTYYEMNNEKNYQVLLATTLSIIFDSAYVKNEYNAGIGRADIIVIPKDNKDLGFIIETKNIKTRTTKARLDESSSIALKQIITKGYDQDLIRLGIKNIILFGIAFYKNKVSISTKKLVNN